jgi:phosphohistidine phosphatase
MMKTLLIFRHAKSSWKNSNLADHDRPLNKRGKTTAPRMGEKLRQEDELPDLILSSSAIRASRSAELFAEAGGYDGEIFVRRDLYAHHPEAYISVLNEVDDRYQRVMIVGHNPGLEELVELLTGDWERLPTAALALIELPIQYWSELDEDVEGELLLVWRPREIF